MGLVGTNAAWSTIELIRLTSTTGSASAGIWIWSITALLIALLTALFVGVWLPMSVMYRTGYGVSIKNAVLCFLIFAFNVIFVTILMAAPFALLAVDVLNYIIYVMMLFYGGSFLMACNVSMGMWIGDMSLNTLYEYEQKQAETSRKGGKKRKQGKPVPVKDAAEEAPEAQDEDGEEAQTPQKSSQPQQKRKQGGGKGGKKGGKRPQYRRR